jgi:hypothetical protein
MLRSNPTFSYDVDGLCVEFPLRLDTLRIPFFLPGNGVVQAEARLSPPCPVPSVRLMDVAIYDNNGHNLEETINAADLAAARRVLELALYRIQNGLRPVEGPEARYDSPHGGHFRPNNGRFYAVRDIIAARILEEECSAAAHSMASVMENAGLKAGSREVKAELAAVEKRSPSTTALDCWLAALVEDAQNIADDDATRAEVLS